MNGASVVGLPNVQKGSVLFVRVPVGILLPFVCRPCCASMTPVHVTWQVTYIEEWCWRLKGQYCHSGEFSTKRLSRQVGTGRVLQELNVGKPVVDMCGAVINDENRLALLSETDLTLYRWQWGRTDGESPVGEREEWRTKSVLCLNIIYRYQSSRVSTGPRPGRLRLFCIFYLKKIAIYCFFYQVNLTWVRVFL